MAWRGEPDRHGLARRGIKTGKLRRRNSQELVQLEQRLKMRLAQIRLYKAQEHLAMRGLSKRQIRRIQAESRALDERIARDLRSGKMKVVIGASGREQIRPVKKGERLTKTQIRQAHRLAEKLQPHKDKVKEPYALATWQVKRKAGFV